MTHNKDSHQKNIVIELKGIGYHIDNQHIFSHVNARIFEKDIVSLLWYNGSGKSTLLKIILGLITPTDGSISRAPWLRMWYVPQKLSFDRQLPLTVRDFFRLYRLSDRQIHDLHTTMPLLDIMSLLSKPLSWLSGGQLQKVLIYHALVSRPHVLLLDEPTAGLDISSQETFYEILDQVHEQMWCTIIMVSHDIHTVYSKSDQVICLHKGICCVGKPQDQKLQTDIKQLFGSYVSPYTHHHDR